MFSLPKYPRSSMNPTFFITTGLRFVQHKLKLGNIVDAARILFVKKRLPVVCIIGNRIVEDWQIFIIFCISILSHLAIAGLAVLICRIIRNANLLTVIPCGILFIQELGALLWSKGLKKIRNLRITICFHPFGKKRMIISIVRIILAGVVFCNDRIRRHPRSFGLRYIPSRLEIPLSLKSLRITRNVPTCRQLLLEVLSFPPEEAHPERSGGSSHLAGSSPDLPWKVSRWSLSLK